MFVVAAHAHDAIPLDRDDDPARGGTDPAVGALVACHRATLSHWVIIPAMRYEPGAELTAIRRRIDHPIIDGDGHIIEYLPLVRDILGEIGGPALTARFDLVVDSGRLMQMLTP